MSFKKTIQTLYKILEKELSPDLTYHSIKHTKDVHHVCKFYIKHYDIKKDDAKLLEIAAVGHDTGFTKVYRGHEQVSALITSDVMAENGYPQKDIRKVKKMILATKVPQSPRSMLARILCDSDLDYLGRDDFKEIGSTLKQEWKNYEIFPNLDEDFDIIQIGFLKGHSYHTDYAQEHRTPVKVGYIDLLEKNQRIKFNKKK